MESMKTSKLEAANLFSLFWRWWGTHQEVKVVKNRHLAALIQAALNIIWVFSLSLLIVAISIVTDLEFWKALGIMAFMIPCFLVYFRKISIYRNAYNDDNDARLHGVVSNITLEKMSDHVP
ncbi:unnamed protein product [Urochloa decumbens]|uniref:Uncharacterized protein n=1 Tax=Urochloa decumbens TaxID=240449 RepID=A0ABC8Y830_9POAL